jgi:hypothetical protein
MRNESDRRVAWIQTSELLPRAVFQSRLLTNDRLERNKYFAECKAKFQGCDLIFFDPDNGLQVASVGKGCRSSAKYVFWDEIEEAFMPYTIITRQLMESLTRRLNSTNGEGRRWHEATQLEEPDSRK